MPALVAGIHVFLRSSPKQDVDGRDKPGHDSGGMVQHDRHALSEADIGSLTRFPGHVRCEPPWVPHDSPPRHPPGHHVLPPHTFPPPRSHGSLTTYGARERERSAASLPSAPWIRFCCGG